MGHVPKNPSEFKEPGNYKFNDEHVSTLQMMQYNQVETTQKLQQDIT